MADTSRGKIGWTKADCGFKAHLMMALADHAVSGTGDRHLRRRPKGGVVGRGERAVR